MHWYRHQCDGDWEHSYGVKIETLDNPGWLVKVDLAETRLADIPFVEIVRGNGDESFPEPDFSRWLICKVEDGKFVGAGGPDDLEAIILTFVEWAKAADG
jgi:hypothetical protein